MTKQNHSSAIHRPTPTGPRAAVPPPAPPRPKPPAQRPVDPSAMEVLGLAPPSRPPPPPANPAQATRPPAPGPSNAPPRVSGHRYQTAVSAGLNLPGATATIQKEEGPIHPAKAKEALMFVLDYVSLSVIYTLLHFALHRRLRDRRWWKTWLDCFDGLADPAK